MRVDRPRVVFSALRGNSGKTFLTVGVGACLRLRGKKVSPFKKGPDYIDAAWLEMATGQPCYNLDLFLMEREGILASFSKRLFQSDGALVEGNRGLYDGMDRVGSYSTAELAKLLKAPVVLVADCTMATRTVAAMILGCQHFDPEVEIKGVILNRVGGARHESVVRSSIEDRCHVPVLGALPKIKGGGFPERHMGLVPPREHPGADKAIEEIASVAERYVDVERLWGMAREAPPLWFEEPGVETRERSVRLSGGPRIGLIRDAAFWFYYPDNLELLEAMGASLVECSALSDERLPELDALYIGGGFPETHAEALANNAGFRRSLREAVEDGLPVYAECGGLMYLGKELMVDHRTYPMAGVFPLRFALEARPQGHGYTILEVDSPNPFYSVGEILHGHEFHYSHIPDLGEESLDFVFAVKRGQGIQGKREGLCHKNVLATYSHIHAAGVKGWARAFLERAIQYRDGQAKHRTAIEAAPVDRDGAVDPQRTFPPEVLRLQP